MQVAGSAAAAAEALLQRGTASLEDATVSSVHQTVYTVYWHGEVFPLVLEVQGAPCGPAPLVLKQASVDSEKNEIEWAWPKLKGRGLCCLFIPFVIKCWFLLLYSIVKFRLIDL